MFSEDVISWIGFGIVTIVGLEVLLSLASALRRTNQHFRFSQLETKKLLQEIDQSPDVVTAQGPRNSWRGYRRFILDEKVTEALNTCSFYIRPLDGEPLPPFEPGQHLGFQLRIPGSKRPTVRNYSLSCGPGDQDRYRITVKKVPPPPNKPDVPPGAGSSFLHDNLKVGDLLEVSSPAGKFILDRLDPRPAVFLAGGIGVTPLLSMLEAICAERLDRKCYFIHAVRNRQDHPFRDHIARLIGRHENIDLHIFYSEPDEQDQETDLVHHGYVDASRLKKLTGDDDLQYYICGPPPMMGSLVPSLEESGVPTDSILTEAFGPASTRKKKSATTSSTQSDGAVLLKILFKRSERAIQWDGESSILELAEDAGIMIDSSCRSGTCGTCEVRLNHGKVTYEEEPSAEIKDGHCLACVAIPLNDIEIQA